MKDLSNIVDLCIKEGLLMQGQLTALTDERSKIVQRVEKSKIWLQKQPDYEKFLKQLQEILHKKHIGTFSELLSYFVKDVLQKDNKSINFELYTHSNLPALRIEAINDGQKENILEGNGGSIANIVSAGLRLIALSRMKNRKFIILDEPDCWLKSDYISLFAKIIGEISQKMNIQTVIISHYHWSFFKDYGRVIELKKGDTKLETDIIYDTPSNDSPDDTIKTVRLCRFMSHYDTTYELHPHLTCITGDNDIGKSVISAAFKAVAYGDSSDSYIMHHENEAQVILELNDNRQLLWQRFRKTDQDNPQKVKFTLFKKDLLQPISEFNSYETPEFIRKELNISRIEDIDVHIGNQKQPVFLLSSDTKPQERAKILSLGKESLIIQKMMENIKSKTKQHKAIIKEGEERFKQIERMINVLSNSSELVSTAEDLKSDLFLLDKERSQIDDLGQIIDQLTVLKKLSEIPKVEDYSLEAINFHNIEELDSVIKELSYNQKLASLVELDTSTIEYDLIDTSELTSIIEQLTVLKKLSEIPKVEDYSLDAINFHDTEELESIIRELSYNQKLASLVELDTSTIEYDLIDTSELTSIIEQLTVLKKLSEIPKVEDYSLDAINFHDTEELESIIRELSYNQKLASLVELDTSTIEYDLIDTSELTRIIQQLENLEKLQKIKPIDTTDLVFDASDYLSLEYLSSIIEQMEFEKNNLLDAYSKKENVSKWRIKIDEEIEKFLLENHFCPTCSQKIDKQHILGETHA